MSAGVEERLTTADARGAASVRGGAAATPAPGHPAPAASAPVADPSDAGRPRARSLAARGLPALAGLLLPAALLLLWQVAAATDLVEDSRLPAPADVVAAGLQLVERGELTGHLAISLQRVLLGFAIGASAAVVVAITTGLSRTADLLVSPTVAAVRAVPSLAWVPLFVLYAGISELPKVGLVAIGAFFPVHATLLGGLRAIDPQWREVARAYGLSTRQTITTVLVPAAAPSLLSGLRIGLAQAWLFLVAAELISSSMGLGFLLVDSQNTGRLDRLLLTIVLLALLGKVTDVVVAAVERRVVRRLR